MFPSRDTCVFGTFPEMPEILSSLAAGLVPNQSHPIYMQ